MTPHHVQIEAFIRSDEWTMRRLPDEIKAGHFGDRVKLYVNDARDSGCTIYMYARRAAHWALESIGERGPDRLSTYYRRA